MILRYSFNVSLFFLAIFFLVSCEKKTSDNMNTQDSLMLSNLMTVYEMEVNSTNKFILYAKESDKEGLSSIELLFRTISQSDRIITESFSKIIKSYNLYPDAKVHPVNLNNTKDNLDSAIAFKISLIEQFRSYLKTYEKSNNKEVIETYKKAINITEYQKTLLLEAKQNLEGASSYLKELHICSECGNISKTIEFDICPICKVSKEKYFRLIPY